MEKRRSYRPADCQEDGFGPSEAIAPTATSWAEFKEGLRPLRVSLLLAGLLAAARRHPALIAKIIITRRAAQLDRPGGRQC